MQDNRIDALVKVLLYHSCELKKGEKLLIEAEGVDYMLVNALVKEAYKIGAYPFVEMFDNRVRRELLLGETEELAKLKAKYASYRMEDMDAHIEIIGGENNQEFADVPEENMRVDNEFFFKPVHLNLRVNTTKWVIVRYPTQGMAQLAGMSTDAFEDFYFKVCTLNYTKLGEIEEVLRVRLEKADKVRIIAKDTDISFSIKGIGARKSFGLRNIPCGEVYSAPIKDSVNGTITYNVPSMQNGFKFENICLTFKDGKIIKATANDTEKLNAILDTDDGARYIGEFAFGVNPYITKAIGDVFFDEKMTGTIHFTPGACYNSCYNGNKSAIHWDLVQSHKKEHGGGEIYIDGELIRKDGLFIPDDLQVLNPENLKKLL